MRSEGVDPIVHTIAFMESIQYRPAMTDDAALKILFAELEAALRVKDRDRALELERAISQRLAANAAESAAMERRLRALMAQLETPQITIELEDAERREITRHFDPFDLERGATPDEEKGVDYPVWFATNRKPAAGGGFGGERSNTVTRGRAVVHVPKAHRFGETGSGFFTRLVRGDDRLRVKEIAAQAMDVFYAGVREAIEVAREAGDEPQALVFLHGYNVSFQDAAIRAAQIGYDLKVPGPVAFFSWPSRGNPAAYPADEASIEASEQPIAEFLVEFAQNCTAGGRKAPKLHLIAHSMGNRGFLRALQRIAASAELRGKVHFNQIILAAPDVDRDLFLSLAALYRAHADGVTLYASRGDLAVHLSAKLHDAPRAGYFVPYTVTPGVDTIAVPNFDVDLLGHSYFAQAEALLHDIFDLLRHGEPPVRRQRIEAAKDGDAVFWRLRR
jgi:esterase/lipase superfamily enzyme